MMTARICFVGLENLPVLAAEFEQGGIGGAQVQQTLLARALVRRGFPVSMVVGDRPSTDGLFARRLGVRYGLVLSGVTPPGHGPLAVTPDLEEPDLTGIVDLVLGVP